MYIEQDSRGIFLSRRCGSIPTSLTTPVVPHSATPPYVTRILSFTCRIRLTEVHRSEIQPRHSPTSFPNF